MSGKSGTHKSVCIARRTFTARLRGARRDPQLGHKIEGATLTQAANKAPICLFAFDYTVEQKREHIEFLFDSCAKHNFGNRNCNLCPRQDICEEIFVGLTT